MNKRILFISNTNPFSNSFGAEQRSYSILTALKSDNFSIDIAYVGTTPCNYSYKDKKIRVVFWNKSHKLIPDKLSNVLRLLTLKAYNSCKNIAPHIREIINKNTYDAIICRYLSTAYICGIENNPLLILDLDDHPVQAFRSALFPKKDILHKIYYKLMENALCRAISSCKKKCKTTFLANYEDAYRLGFSFLPNISLNNVERSNHIKKCKRLLFIGKMDYKPNYEGIDHFIENIWKNIISLHSDCELYIAGAGLSSEKQEIWESTPNVHTLGFVDDIVSFYNSANIVIVPVYSGSGTNIKSIEALSMGKAVVMTKFSSKGICKELKNGVHAMISDSDEKMSKDICSLLENDSLCSQIQANGLSLAKKLYSVETISNILNSIINNTNSK